MTEAKASTGLADISGEQSLEGRWAKLPDGTVVRIISVDGSLVLAETAGGRSVDRPLTHVLKTWQLLEDGALSVRVRTDPDAVKAAVKESPVDLVVWALAELGGTSQTGDIKALIENAAKRFIGSHRAFVAWWRRVQSRLGDDPRIDDSRSLERRYRLLGSGEKKPRSDVRFVSDQLRLGRRLAFGPALRSARERARNPKNTMTPEERADAELVSRLVDLKDLDATDRFMAAELSVWLGLRSEDSIVMELGDDLLAIDLARVSQNASKLYALRLLGAWLDIPGKRRTLRGEPAPVTLSTALAQGVEWDHIAPLAGRVGTSKAGIVELAISWGCPGSEESEPTKLPADYDPFQKRLAVFEQRLKEGHIDELVGIERGALVALGILAWSSTHQARSAQVIEQTATLATRARLGLPEKQRAADDMIAALQPDRIEALLRPSGHMPDGWAAIYTGAIEAAVARNPMAYPGPLTRLATLLGEDPGAVALRVARRAASDARVGLIALLGAEVASDPLTRSWCVELAGIAQPDDPAVKKMLQRETGAARSPDLDGEANTRTVASPEDWPLVMASVRGQVGAVRRERDDARAQLAEANERIRALEATAGQARQALAESRLSDHSTRQRLTATQRASILKPVATALADSLEVPNLEALQDRLAAVLDRAQVVAILEPGRVVPFDPDLHRWVGEAPYPSALVRAISPGFLAKVEGEDDIVLVQARVVAGGEA